MALGMYILLYDQGYPTLLNSVDSMTIRTGCSAALVGLHEACSALQRGDCTAAIVGGANLILAPGMTQAMTEQGVLAPDGSCKTFSADADGYARGEAISAIYIKPLDAALKDGNPIRAIIRATATNSDGRTPGISYPSTEAHEAMMRKVYDSAGIDDFSTTTFVECHGTGTAVRLNSYITFIFPVCYKSVGASALSQEPLNREQELSRPLKQLLDSQRLT